MSQADSPLESWKVHDRSAYLDELLRHDGRAGESSCAFCGDCNGLYKCKDCFGGSLHCQRCVVQQHLFNPLHRIEVRTITRPYIDPSHIIFSRNGMDLSSSERLYANLV
jgi:hypothetical protein